MTTAELRKLLERATQGNWLVVKDGSYDISICELNHSTKEAAVAVVPQSDVVRKGKRGAVADAAAIAALHNVAPELLAIVEAAQEWCLTHVGTRDPQKARQMAARGLTSPESAALIAALAALEAK